MKLKKVRTIIAVVVFAVLAGCLIGGVALGTFSSFGPGIVSVLCPLGALESMIASKTLIPRAFISVVVLAVVFFVVGRAFCAWLCPIGILKTIQRFFRSPRQRKAQDSAKRHEITEIAKFDLACGHACGSCQAACSHAGTADAEAGAEAPVPSEEALSTAGADAAYASKAKQGLNEKGKRPVFDSRHGVLLGALASTAIFGFPVFCLVCPVGLCFAAVLLIWRLFAFGDVTVAIVLVIAILVIELVFLRNWCSRFCPMAALMNLMGRKSVTLKPTIDEKKCLESVNGVACSQCAIACEYDINLRHLAAGTRGLADCTRCGACKEACPAGAITIPFLPKKGGKGSKAKPADGSAEENIVMIADNGFGKAAETTEGA